MPRLYFQETRHELKPAIPQRYNTVLEIGCGSGNFRQHLTRQHTYWGVEPNQEAALQAKCKIDTLLNGTFDEVFPQLPKAHFDLVICNDVIEHLPDTDKLLTSLQSVMTPNAYLIGSIPNIRYLGQLFELLYKKDWQYREAGILDKTHLRFYTEKSFRNTLADNNFDMPLFWGINGPQPKNIVKKLLLGFGTCVFGGDTRHPQFAFQAQLKG